MIRIASRITFLLQIALFLVLGEYDRCVNAQSSISGVVRVGGGILPVADAVVVLDRDADPTLVDHLTESDSFGLFSFDEVISGAYTLRVSRPGFQLFEQPVQVIEGLQIEVGVSVEPLAEPSFDLFVDVSGVVSSLNLSSVPLVVSQFRSQTDAAPIQTWERMTDAQGSMELLGMTVGFYQFEVNSGPQARPKWFSYTTATNGFAKRRLDRDSQVMMLLEPDGADLQVQVTGFNPQLGQDSVLTNILVDLAGVSFTDHDAVVIPNRTGETYHLGQETFTNLPAIPWRLRAKRFGYEMSEIVVQPGADGTLPKQVSVSMNLENTGIDVVLDSPFTNRELKNRNKDVSGRFHDGLFLVLEGLPNSNTAGITRFSEAVYDEDREEPVARFRQLLPGNYRVFVPQGSGAISPYVYAKDGRDTQLFVGFTGSDVVDAVLGTISEATLIVEPIPAVVRGRLMVADERGLAGKPVFQPRAEKGIHFSEYEFAEMFDDEVSLQVASDSLGQFTMELPPGFYGVTLPNMTNYFGSRVHVTSSSDPTDTDRQGWPYAEPFLKDDRPVWSFHHGLGMPLSSGQEYEVVLFVRKQVAHVEGSLAADFDDRLRDLVLSWPNVTRRYMDLADAGNAFLKLGDGSGVTLISPLESSVGENRAFFDFPAVPPGTHTLVFSHPRNETPTETVEIPAWDAPGVKPTRDPLDFSEKFPFDTWSLEALGATSVGDDLPAINVESWTGSSYRNLGSIKVPTVLELVSRPGRFYVSDFRSSNFKWPKEPVHYWINVNSQWHAGTYTPGTALPSTVFVGGPDNTFSPDGPGFSGYDLTYRAYSLSDTTMGVDAVDIKTDSNQDIKILASANPGLPVGTVVKTGFEGEFSPNTVVNGAGWVWEEFEGIDVETGFDSVANRFKVEVGVYMKRGMGLRGTVKQVLDGAEVVFPNVPVRVLSRYGELLREAETDEDGVFKVTPSFDSPQTVFIEVNQPGYEPYRRRVASIGEPEGGGDPPVVSVDDIVVKALPQPAILPESIQLDRKGLFLVGVKDAGPKDRFSGRQEILDRLTMTWSASGKSESASVTLVKFDRPDGASGGSEQITLNDPVESVWMIDPRAYDVDRWRGIPRVLSAPTSEPNPAKRLQWLRELSDGTQPNVFFQSVNVSDSTDGDGVGRAEAKVKLWELPSGEFSPIFALVTKGGATRFYDQFQRDANERLMGTYPPEWAASLLNAGSLANLSSKEFKSESNRFQAEGRVTVGPLLESNIILANQFLRYDYGIDMNWRDGASTPQAGIWSLAPGFLGLRFGGMASFGVHGDQGTSFFSSGGLFSSQFKIGDDDDSLWDDYKFGLFKAGAAVLPETEISGSVTARWKESETKWSNPNAKYELETVREVNGGVNLALKQDVRPLAAFLVGNTILPGAGKGLAKVIKKLPEQVKFYVTLEGGIGMGVTSTSRTLAPYVIENNLSIGGGRTVIKPEIPEIAKNSKHVLRRHVMGGLETANSYNLCFRFAVGGAVEAFGGRLGATLKVVGDGPQQKCVWPAVTIHPNFSGGFPWIDKAEANIRIEAEAYANLYVVQLKSRVQLEHTATFERGTDPFFDIFPLTKSSVALSPANALPGIFSSNESELITGFFDPGTCQIGGESQNALLFTDINEDGLMSLKMSTHLGGIDWAEPVEIAEAAGILDSAVLEMANGKWLVVWSQITSNGIGLMNPSSQIRYRIGDSSAMSWSAPVTLGNLDDASSQLQLVRLQEQATLIASHSAAGPFSDVQSLARWDWDGAEWSGGDDFLSNVSLLQWQTIGSSDSNDTGLFASVSSEGEVEARWMDSTTISDPDIVVATGASMLALARQGEGVLLLSNDERGGLVLNSAPDSGSWSDSVEVVADATPNDIELQPLDGTEVAVGWVSGGSPSEARVITWDTLAEETRSPSRLVFQGSDRLSGLQLLGGGGGLLTLFKEGSDPVKIRQFEVSLSNAPLIESFEFVDSGELVFVIQVSPGSQYRLEGSADLITWESLVEAEVVESPWRVLDAQNQNRDWQFYRIVRVEP